VLHFLRAFPIDTMRDGDVFVTNDPWKGTGHLFDVVMVTPVFHDGQPVALFASTVHVVDIGGVNAGPDALEIFHEGLFLPPLRFVSQGVIEEAVLDIVRANVREPGQVEGDFHALVACCASSSWPTCRRRATTSSSARGWPCARRCANGPRAPGATT
jgi:N-methylhydantoinase B